MITYQRKTSDECVELTSEAFAQLVVSDEVVSAIKRIRTLRAQGKDKGADLTKRALPLICYQTSRFDPTEARSDSRDGRRKKGQRGRWRVQEAARLNGLFMLDVDHVDNPRGLYKNWRAAHPELFADPMANPSVAAADQAPIPSGGVGGGLILLVHVTSSNAGLRVVAIADPSVGNLADNQAALARQLGVGLDASCKDASRGSFCPGFEDILFINKEKLFNYENIDYDEKYGPQYRGRDSKPTRQAAARTDGTRGVAVAAAAAPAGPAGAAPAEAGGAHAADGGAAAELERTYKGVTYEKIIQQWFHDLKGGMPAVGDRHQSLFQLACDLRYITDADESLLESLLAQCAVGQVICRERGRGEIARIASDANSKQLFKNIPRQMRGVLANAGVRLGTTGAGAAAGPAPRIDYGAWWQRLHPLLDDSPGFREAVATLPDEHKIGGVLAAGAMLGTYLTRTWWTHFDGKAYRLSFLVYIIGNAASGKSFVVDMDRLIMAPMLAADKVGREWERKYKEEMKRRAASSKDARVAAPEQQHPVIRYVPSTISNAMLYRRLTDALDPQTLDALGEPLHLHIYTCEAELATALRVQQGSWAGKMDLECKSFQNEMAGVDYANDQSQNGIIQVNWNQVVSGTPDAMRRKIRPATVLDGLVTRLCVFTMPQNDYAMIERRRVVVDHERECLLRSLGLRLEQVKGELKCERLVDYSYDYERELTEQAAMNEDRCLDYFRKRIPLIMVRYALVRAVLRQLPQVLKGEELHIEDSDLEFARLVGDFVLMEQMYMFGNDVMDALEAQDAAFVPRRRANKTKERFDRLPQTFSREMMVELMPEVSNSAISKILLRWQEDGLIRKENDKYIKKGQL